GYGDVVPKSALGKLLSVPLLMFGLLLIALPSFVLGRNFAIVYDAMVHTIPQAPTPADSPPPSPRRGGGVLTPVDEADSVPLLPVTAPA
ncbi:potassium channel family protein, partial [Enterobacter hormaechei]|nr:potassium channel family protein [Enterobacter hormaechei]